MPELSGWGRFVRADCVQHHPDTQAALADLARSLPQLIMRGNGRAYGDAALNPAATVASARLARLIAFDPATGDLACEAGVLVADLIDTFLPRGWIVPVSPGTRFVSVGGMVAADVHGKNHHAAGSFADHLAWVDLALGDGRVLRCSREENADLFAATCGGMGLTGAIMAAGFRLLRVESAYIRQTTIRAPDLAAAMAAFEATAQQAYAVAWIDCLASGSALGRSVVMAGDHAHAVELPGALRNAPFTRPARRALRLPCDLPPLALSRFAVRLFNRAYYAAHRPGTALVGLENFFYPLDAFLEWNRMYGARGFVQFQCVLPLASAEAGLRAMLAQIAERGQASFLAVLKRMGQQSLGYLSFPMEGYTLALDFPASPANLALVRRLGDMAQAHGGRIYLAKDAVSSPQNLAAGYPQLAAFRSVRARYGVAGRFASLLSARLELD